MPSDALAARRRVSRLVAASVLALSAGLAACGARGGLPAGQADIDALRPLPWDSIVARARGTEVVWRMWRGDPSINAYVDGWVARHLRERYGIVLRAVDGQGPELINQLVVERESRRRGGTASLLWINGETFANLRKEGLLAGPWAGRLPNAAFVDSASPIVRRDFEQDPAGYESPWGRVQFALIYDTLRTPTPPRSVAQLAVWIRAHPGRFTFDQEFTGTTFQTILVYALNGGVSRFQGGFDSTRYAGARDRVFVWLDSLRPFLWRGGETFPPNVAAMHRLFANDEIDFSMSHNQNEVISKAEHGVLARTARPLLLRDGTIANTHYVGIPFNAPNAAGAMVVADFLLSPDAQIEKQRPDVWADGTVLDMARLPGPARARFTLLGTDPRELPFDSLARYAVPEVSPRYHERLAADWRAHAAGHLSGRSAP